MGLLMPRKGAGPATGKVRSSRAEQLLSATQALAAEQLPDEHTMAAIEQPSGEEPQGGGGEGEGAGAAAPVPASEPEASRPSPAAGRGDAVSPEGALVVRMRATGSIRPSPFQPKGRPSAQAVAAVRGAILDAGSLEALVGPEGGARFARLDPEAARLAELAFDVAEHGMKVPVEVRVVDGDVLECLSGHRRLAAAMLAGLAEVPTLDRGALSNAAAAATVLRGNLHRENFTSWQEAVLVTEVQERRRADGYRDNVRTLATVMGWSHGKVNMLLRIRRALGPEFLARIADDPGWAEERLARASYRDLERLAADPDDEQRLRATRRLLGIDGAAPGSPRATQPCVHRPKRGGGFLIEVNAPVESLAASDAEQLRELLTAQLTRVSARLDALRQR